MKTVKKIVAALLVAIMLVGVAPLNIADLKASAANTNGHSRTDAVNWAKSKIGQSLDRDDNGYWCVDLIYYYYEYLGQSRRGGNGSDYANSSKCPNGWTQIRYNSNFLAKPGDIAVWTLNGSSDPKYNSYGHVGIVTACYDGLIEVLDQRGIGSDGKKHISVNYSTYKMKGGLMTFWGVIRPNFCDDTINVTLKSPANITNNSADISCGFSNTMNYSAMYVAYGTVKSDVNVDYTKDSNRKSTDNRSFKNRDISGNKSGNDASTDLINLSPGTTYYYKMVFKDTSDKYYQSDLGSFTTTNNKPKSTTISLDSGYENIAVGDIAKISWAKSDYAENYRVELYNDKNELVKSAETPATSYAFDALTEAGEYKVKAYAINSVGETALSGEVKFNVNPDITVTFTIFDDVYETVIIPWGHDCDEPAIPMQYGYDFKGWNGSLRALKSDTVISGKFEKKVFTVDFVNGLTGEKIATQSVKYNEKATVPDKSTVLKTIPNGYKKDTYYWSVDVEKTPITEDTTIKSVYLWYNNNYNIYTSVDSITRSESKNGYDYSVLVKNNSESAVSGRLVIALKNEDDYIYIKTDSLAFNLNGKEEKTINGFVASDSWAYSADVFTIGSYDNAGPIAEPVVSSVDNSGGWSEPIAYKGEVPVQVGVNGVTAVKTDEKDVDYYRYRTSETVDSYDPNLESQGWTKTGYSLEKVSTKTNDYVDKWGTQSDSVFYTGNGYYKKYNNKKISASDTATQVVTIDKTVVKSYIYWHWCASNSKSYLSNHKETCTHNGVSYTYSGFDAFESTENLTLQSPAGHPLYVKEHSCCNYGVKYWWNDRITVYTQTVSTYKKVYHYVKYSSYGNPTTETPAERGITDKNLYTVSSEKVNVYQYKSESFNEYGKSATKMEVDGTISGRVDASLYGGKNAIVYIYKYTQPSDYTNEYVSTTVIGSNGEVNLNDVILRESPESAETDFKVAVAVEGYTGVTEVTLDAVSKTILSAPKKTYTVTFYNDKESKTVLKKVENVEEGGNVAPPSADLVILPEGQQFVRWSVSTAGVNSDLEVYPETEAKDCVVVLIDWNSRKYDLQELKYGDEIKFFELNQIDNYESYWITDELTKSGDKYIATKNTVITSNYVPVETEAVYIQPEYLTMLQEKYPELDMEAFCGDLMIFLENNEMSDLFSEKGNGVYGFADESEKLEFITSIIDEQFIAFLAESFAELPESERTKIINELSTLFDEMGLFVSEKTGEDYIDVPDTDPAYIFMGWKSIKTGEYLINTKIPNDDVFLPVYEFANTCDLPEASLSTGEYLDDSISVTLSCSTEKSVIWYTISNDMNDFKDPRIDGVGIEYKDGDVITIKKSSVLTFYATSLGYNDSGLMTELYAMNGSGKGTKYYIVNVYNNIYGGVDETYYQYLIKEGQQIDISNITGIEGFTFDGIYYDADYEEEFDYKNEFIDDTLDANEQGILMLYAKYTPKKFNISFYDYDGSLLKPETVDYGMSATAPEVSREGYVFIGWSSDDYLYVTKGGVYTAVYVSNEDYAMPSFSRTGKTQKAGGIFDLGAKLSIQYHGEKMKLSEYIVYDKDVKWYTDSNIATVDYNGKVSFLKNGKVKVFVLLKNGETASVNFEVSASDADIVTLSSNARLKEDSNGYIREVKAGETVSDIKDQFLNDELVFVNAKGETLKDDDLIGTGSSALLYDEDGSLLSEKIFVVTGDFDGDGKITVQDASHVQAFVVERETAKLYQELAIDCNGDGRVNSRDASMILRYCVGKETF